MYTILLFETEVEDAFALFLLIFFFCQGFLSRALTTHRTVGDGGGTIFYSTVQLPPAHEHSDIYLYLCMWDDYSIFLIALLAFTRLLLDEIYYLLELKFNWLCEVSFCLYTWWFDIRFFVTAILIRKTDGLERASTITLVLQANWYSWWSFTLVKSITKSSINLFVK